MWMLFLLLGALTLGNAYWYFMRGQRRGVSLPWKIGLGVLGGGLNVILFLRLNRFVDGHMPNWFYRLVIKNELLAISLVMLAAAVIVFLIGWLCIWRRAADRPNPFAK